MAGKQSESGKKNILLAQTKESIEKRNKTRKENVIIRHAIYDELKAKLLSEDNKGKAYYQNFMDKFLELALKHPESRPGQTVAETIFQKELLSMLDAQKEQQMNRDKDFQRYRIIKKFFQQQRDVILETNHQKRILACCSRRAGKTDLASGAINNAAVIPNSRIIYINLTFTNAINQIWNNVVETAEECGLIINKKSKADGIIEYANGSSLRIVGNPNNTEIEKLRGESKVSLVVIDEFFHQRNMQYAIDEVITPLLADREDSTILCMGTPPKIAKTYGEKCWNEKGWKKYHWTMFDNPYMPNPEKYLEDLCESKGLALDCPYIQREYFGKIGVYDIEALVFKNRKTYNKYDTNFPVTDVVIGVDYGYSDYNAMVTIAYNKNTKKSFVVKESKFNKAGVSEIIDEIKKHYEFAKEICSTNNISSERISIYCDTNEESITHDLMSKYKLPAFNCYKYDKSYAIEMLAEELRTGRMQIPNNGLLDEEMEQILYKRDENTDAILPEIDDEFGIHPDIMMALLYASRKMFFDMDYDISFKESKPKTSNFITSATGTIIGVAEDDPTEIIGGDGMEIIG